MMTKAKNAQPNSAQDPDEPLYLQPQFAAEALGISLQTLRKAEKDFDLDITRVPRGAVSARVYTPDDLFQIASLRRDKPDRKNSPPFVISTYVQKGGTGKTTVSVNQAIILGLMGLKVLLIDNDPQGDCTSALGYDPDLDRDELIELGFSPEKAVDGHIGNLLQLGNMCPQLRLEDIVKKPFGENGPHLIPADDTLDEVDTILRAAPGGDFRYSLILEKAIKGSVPDCDLSRYDVIIFDNAPSGSLLSRNAMTAADMLICPIRMDKFSFKALSRLQHKIIEFEELFSRSADVLAVPTMFIKGRPRAQANLAKVAGLFPGSISNNLLYFSEDYSKALEDNIPIALWKGASDNSLGAMRKLGHEIYQRMAALI